MPFADITVSNPAVAIPVALATALVAYGVIWRKAIVPLAHFFRNVGRIADATPVLVTIAEEFRPNDGHSLRDTVDSIESKLDAAKDALDKTTASVDTTYLSLVAWGTARDEIVARIAILEDRQSRILDGLTTVFSTGGSVEELIAGIKQVLTVRVETTTPITPDDTGG